MSIVKFISSKVFFKHLAIMVVIILALSFGIMKWLNVITNHGEELTVPDLRKLTLSKVSEKLEGIELEYVLTDSVDYRSDFPPLSVVKQDPMPGEKVKKNRKIYIKINSSTFGNVKLPELIQVSYRQAIPTLKAVGLEVGQISYIPNIGKDMVLEVKQNGRILKAGDKVKKASKIDLVLGDGGTTQPQDSTELIQQIINDVNSF
jgi:beta-lactam-binding protein with PASTA domain